MNFVFFSPNFPPQYYQFGAALKKLGANVLGIGDIHYDHLSSSQKSALTEYYRVGNLQEYDQVLRAMGYFTHCYGKIDQIDSFNEYWMQQEAHLRTDFNIPGLKFTELLQLQQKSFMKDIFHRAGVATAAGELYKTPEKARKFASENGYPIIAKPDMGVGASKTQKINNATNLEHFISSDAREEGYFLEAFINGQLESFDGLTNKNGQVVFYTSHVFNQGIMDVVNDDLDMYYYSRREIPQDLTDAGMKIIKTLDLKGRFFHIEFFRTPDNKLVALEINLRPPGGFTIDMFNYANNFDIYHQWACVSMNNQQELTWPRPYHVCYAGRKDHLHYTLSHDEVLKVLGNWLVYHGPITPALSDAIGNYGYILRDQDFDEIIRMTNLILQKV